MTVKIEFQIALAASLDIATPKQRCEQLWRGLTDVGCENCRLDLSRVPFHDAEYVVQPSARVQLRMEPGFDSRVAFRVLAPDYVLEHQPAKWLTVHLDPVPPIEPLVVDKAPDPFRIGDVMRLIGIGCVVCVRRPLRIAIDSGPDANV